MMPQRVAVIGAGAAGLVTLRYLASDPENFTPVAFDKNGEIGGLWNYSENTVTDERGLPCAASIYHSLRINLPKEIMNFPDLDFPEDLPSFPHHTEVKKYLDSFADKFHLRQYIKVNTQVIRVKPCASPTGITWLVTSRDLDSEHIVTSEHDVIIICNGKEAVGYVPDIPGKNTFNGQILHSKNYRHHKDFTDKTVMILGASYSGGDMMFELAPVVTKLYIAHRHDRLLYELPANVQETSSISQILPNGVILENGECREVDAIIFATGYKYDFPFLSEECGLTLNKERVQPLYRHIFNIKYPTMCCVGLLKEVAEFRIADLQAQYVFAVLKGEALLPTASEMLREEEEDYQSRVVAKKLSDGATHNLYKESQQFLYWNKISADTHIKPYPPVLQELFNYVCTLYDTNFGDFKRRNFRLNGSEAFEELNSTCSIDK